MDTWDEPLGVPYQERQVDAQYRRAARRMVAEVETVLQGDTVTEVNDDGADC